MTAKTPAELATEIATFETGVPGNVSALKERDMFTNMVDSATSVFGSTWTLEGTFSDFTDQIGVEDVPKTILIGEAKTSTNGHVHVDATGVVTIVNGGAFFTESTARLDRTGGAGASEVVLWTEASPDGGATWIVTPDSHPLTGTLNGATDDVVIRGVTPINAPSGAKFRTRFARSSTGHDSGDLVGLELSATLKAAAPGLTDQPSAFFEMFILPGNEYVPGTSGVVTITLDTGGVTADANGSYDFETSGSDGRGCVLNCQVSGGTISAINSVTFKGIGYKALDVLSITGPNLSTPGTATVDTIG